MKYLLFLAAFFFLFSCKNEKGRTADSLSDLERKSEKIIEKALPTSEIPFLWKNYLCSLSEFSSFFYCDTSNSDRFEINFMNDPFKDPLLISIEMGNNGISDIYFSRFSFHYDSLSFKMDGKTKQIKISLPYDNGTIFCSYLLPKKIVDRSKFSQLDNFFLQELWKLPFETDEPPELDGEGWYVFARKGGIAYKWRRYSFADSIYYSNLQTLLDLCGVEDFKYEAK